MITLAGAMSTAELGRSLAEMIRQDKVHIISCTGANLEEGRDEPGRAQSLRAHSALPATLSPGRSSKHCSTAGLNRVTDTCIPEEEAFRKLEGVMVDLWKAAEAKGERKFPHEFFYEACDGGDS